MRLNLPQLGMVCQRTLFGEQFFQLGMVPLKNNYIVIKM